MERYYSQHGEDFLLGKIFAGKKDGYFVEIGCLDGVEFSNTYYFEKIGWKGLCVEAHRDFIKALRKNRPGSDVIHCAIGEADRDEVTFYANKLGSLSTLNKSEEERWKKGFQEYFHGFEEQKVSMRTMTSVFDEFRPAAIDFVSLDIEGYEIQALEGLDFKKYKPVVFVIEYKDDEHKKQLESILFPQGYHFILRIGCNLFYSLDASHREIVRAKYGALKLVTFDNGVEKENVVYLQPPLRVKIKERLKRSVVGKSWRFLRGLRNAFGERLRVPSYRAKRKVIDQYRRDFGLRTLVETGTFLGDTVEFFKDRFDRIYSIELSEELFAEASKRFQNSKHITILQGDSGVLLQSLVKTINAPTLFWLDGHYSSEFYYGDRYIKTARGEKVTPILAELDAVLNDDHLHVILIDDARLFNGDWEYPELKTIYDIVGKFSDRYEVTLARDIIRICPVLRQAQR